MLIKLHEEALSGQGPDIDSNIAGPLQLPEHWRWKLTVTLSPGVAGTDPSSPDTLPVTVSVLGLTVVRALNEPA